MSDWFMGSKPNGSGQRDCAIVFHNDDAVGAVKGRITFFGLTFEVTGSWAAAGSVPERKHSVFAVWGSDGSAATHYLTAIGSMHGPGQKPESIEIAVNRVGGDHDAVFVWQDVLKPM